MKSKQIKKEITKLNIDGIIDYLGEFNDDKKPTERYASFDYCFNYFQNFKNKKDIASSSNIQNSCLQLGFYLASWGMYRGSTFLLQKSLKVFEPLIEYIGSDECNVWDIDVNNYNNDSISRLIICEKKIRGKLGIHGEKNQEATDTLITKIMLGVFGNVPAFDDYFKKGSGLGVFNEKALLKIKEFYDEHRDIILKQTAETKTYEYKNGSESKRSYTEAKVIDMIFFTKGLNENKKII